MTRVDYCGRMYDEHTDFLSELREATRNAPVSGPSWLRSDLPLPWALTDWAQALKGTPMEQRLADAALKLIETGTVEQAEAVAGLPFELADNAIERVLEILRREPMRLGSDPRSIPSALWRLLQRAPSDPRVADAIRREATKPTADEWTRNMASRLP